MVTQSTLLRRDSSLLQLSKVDSSHHVGWKDNVLYYQRVAQSEDVHFVRCWFVLAVTSRVQESPRKHVFHLLDYTRYILDCAIPDSYAPSYLTTPLLGVPHGIAVYV